MIADAEISKMFVFFSELLGRNVFAADRRHVAGRLVDLRMRLGEMFPRVTGLVFRRRYAALLELPWEEVEAIDGNRIHLRADAAERATPLKPASTGELLLRDELLDKQVVDTAGAKVERVNDLHFLINSGQLRLVHVDVGMRGILRRLGWIRGFDASSNWLFAYQLPDKLISWKYVQPLTADPQSSSLKLNVASNRLSTIHPSDLADILEELDHERRNMLLQSLDAETAADAIEELDDRVKLRVMEDVGEKRAAEIISEMEPDEAADLLEDLPEERKASLISGIETEKRIELEELLSYPEGTAGSLMTSEPIVVSRSTTVGEALERVKGLARDRELLYYVYVTEMDGRLAGVVTLRSLFVHEAATPVEVVMTANPISVEAGDRIGDLMSIFKKYNFLSVPVVDTEGKLKGFVTIRDALDAAMPEFAER